MINTSCFYVLSFDSTSYAMAAEKILGQNFNITVIPTPREITQNCGISIKINDDNLKRIMEEIKKMAVPCTLYRIDNKGKYPRCMEVIFSVY